MINFNFTHYYESHRSPKDKVDKTTYQSSKLENSKYGIWDAKKVGEIPPLIIVDAKPADIAKADKTFSAKFDTLRSIRDYIAKLHTTCHKQESTMSLAGIVAGRDKDGRLDNSAEVYSVGTMRVYRYYHSGEYFELINDPTTPLGAVEQCPEIFRTKITVHQFEFGHSKRQSILICDERVAETLGDSGIESVFKQGKTANSIEMSKLFSKAAQAAGATDFGLYVIQFMTQKPEGNGGMCWDTSCERWSTCNGYECPAGNWHDI